MSARKFWDQIIETYKDKILKMTILLDKVFYDITAVLALFLKYRKLLLTTNDVESPNHKIRRRKRVIRILPNETSVVRLMEVLLIKHDEKW